MTNERRQSRFRPYPVYKPSGIEWLGDVPEYWNVDRLKWSTQGAINGTWGDEPNGADDIVCVRVADFDRERFLVADAPPTMRAVDSGQRDNRLLRRGDLLIEKSGGGEKQLVGCVVLFDHDYSAVCSNFVARMPVSRGMHPRFWCYIHAALYASHLNYPSIKQTTGIQNLDTYAYLNERMGFPKCDEQRVISDFLDRETAKIDTLIAKKRALIEKLSEKRSALISHTVARGLPSGAARATQLPEHPISKPSGLSWLGDIPAHWSLVPAKLVSSIFVPQRDKPELNTDGDGYPWITVEDLTVNTVYKSEKDLSVSFESARSTGSRTVPAGSVLASCVGTFGIASIAGRELIINQQLQAYLPTRVHPLFLSFVVRASVPYFEQMATAATIAYVNADRFGSLPIPLPPLPEQEAIAEYLGTETSKLDRIVAKVSKAVDLLKEQRTALIAAAVTGKIDLREEYA
jgi:type I restriction enzyme S subunit